MLWYDFGVMCDFGCAKMFSAAILEIYLHHKDIHVHVCSFT